MVWNFSFVIPDKLAGGAHPGAGEEALSQALQEMRAEHGITAIVSLTEDALAPTPLTEFEIAYLHTPIQDFAVPSKAQADRVVAFVDSHIEHGGKVLVHCGAGYGRTGTLLACCLAARGEKADKAIAAVRHIRPGSLETPQQEQFVRNWAKRRSGGKSGAKG